MNTNKLEYENEVMQLYCHEVYRYVFVRFINNLSPYKYVVSIQNIIDLLKEKQITYLISDVSEWKDSSDISEKWKLDVLLIHLTPLGLRKYAIIDQSEGSADLNFFEHIDSVDKSQIKVRQCSSFEEAENWILRVE